MVMNHWGRFIAGGGSNAWWYAISQYISMPIYFFLTGGGAARRPCFWRLLVGFAYVRAVHNPYYTIGGTVLLLHAMASSLFGAAGFAAWPLSHHCAFIAAVTTMGPVLMDGLWLDAGSPSLMYAGTGAAVVGGAPRHVACLWLAAATATRVSMLIRNEWGPHAKWAGEEAEWGWGTWAPFALSFVFMPPVLYKMITYKREPAPSWVPRSLHTFMRWQSQTSLQFYVVHVALFDIASRYLGTKKQDDYIRW